MSEIHPFYRDNPYPERKWVAFSVFAGFGYWILTRFILHVDHLVEPLDSVIKISIPAFLAVGAWLSIGRIGISSWWRATLFVPLLGFVASIVFLALGARASRNENREKCSGPLV
jgi:EamA domain-containing membrane protein RarD